MLLNAGIVAASVTGIIEDPDAAAYLDAVEVADGQTLEPAVRAAINDFVVGCKADGIWTPIKAACILAGARTLNGALVPLVGTSPTNFNFVSGDYNRKAGLTGDGSTKYLNSGRANNADPQNSKHIALYLTNDAPLTGRSYMGTFGTSGGVSFVVTTSGNEFRGRANQTANTAIGGDSGSSGFKGFSRSTSAAVLARFGNANYSRSQSSTTPSSENIDIFRAAAGYTPSTISFYSIGESLDLALLDSRVSALMTALDSAIS
jgi:hypothetical protein